MGRPKATNRDMKDALETINRATAALAQTKNKNTVEEHYVQTLEYTFGQCRPGRVEIPWVHVWFRLWFRGDGFGAV